jgi:hypothetical protein
MQLGPMGALLVERPPDRLCVGPFFFVGDYETPIERGVVEVAL